MVIWSVLSSKCSMPAQQVAGGPHLSGVDVSVGEIAAAQQRGDLVGVKPVVLGLAAVDRLHVEGMAEDEGEALLFAQVGHPVPAEEAFDRDTQTLPVRSEGFDELGAVASPACGGRGLCRPDRGCRGRGYGRAGRSRSSTCAAGCRISSRPPFKRVLDTSPTAYRVGRPEGGLESVSPGLQRTETA